MRPTTNRTLQVSLGMAALGIVAMASSQSYADPPQPLQGANIAAWVQSTPDHALVSCPTSGSPTDNPPFFNWARPIGTCLLDGPYSWNGKQWWVQRVRGVAPDGHDLIRACTPTAVDANRKSHFAGPCQTAAGAGPLGCETCTIGGLPE